MDDTVDILLDVEDPNEIDYARDKDAENNESCHDKPFLTSLITQDKDLCDTLEQALVWKVDGVTAERTLNIIRLLEIELVSMSTHVAANRRQKQTKMTEFLSL